MKRLNALKQNADFVRVYQNGKSYANRYLVMYLLRNDQDRYANRYLVMYLLRNDQDSIRVGISVSKKVGNSVVRHRVKRLIRESCRLNQYRFEQGCDLVIIARKDAKGKTYSEIEGAVTHLARLHHILRSDE